jgi:hypothetical protein
LKRRRDCSIPVGRFDNIVVLVPFEEQTLVEELVVEELVVEHTGVKLGGSPIHLPEIRRGF